MKTRPGLLNEVKKMFPGDKVVQLGHRGNSALFSAGGRLIKYLPGSALGKYLEVYRLLSARTAARLPELTGIGRSGISGQYLVAMKKVEGAPLTDVWPGLAETGKRRVLRELVSALKQFHSVRFKGKVPAHFRPVEGNPGWKEEVYASCLAELEHSRRTKAIGRELHGALLSFLEREIAKVRPAGYSLLHRDLNFNNVMADKDLKLTLLFDFETCTAGDKYLDLAAAGLFFEDTRRDAFYKLYGVPKGFGRTSGVYRLLSFLYFLRTRKLRKDKEKALVEFITTGRSAGASPLTWLR